MLINPCENENHRLPSWIFRHKYLCWAHTVLAFKGGPQPSRNLGYAPLDGVTVHVLTLIEGSAQLES